LQFLPPPLPSPFKGEGVWAAITFATIDSIAQTSETGQLTGSKAHA